MLAGVDFFLRKSGEDFHSPFSLGIKGRASSHGSFLILVGSESESRSCGAMAKSLEGSRVCSAHVQCS